MRGILFPPSLNFKKGVMDLKKKLLILTMVLLVLTSVIAFADTNIPPLPSAMCKYYAILDCYGARLVLITSEAPFVYDSQRQQIVSYGNEYVFRYECESGESEFVAVSGGYSFGTSILNVVASNHDIYHGTRESLGTEVFFSAPSPIRAALEIMDFGMILRTFSAGLIPLVGLTVLVISFRKGWDFLRNQLTR